MDAQELSGRILVLDQKGIKRTYEDEIELANLYQAFGDHQESALALVRAMAKRSN